MQRVLTGAVGNFVFSGHWPVKSVAGAGGDPLPAAQLGDAVLAPKAIQDDADFLLRRMVLARRMTDITDGLLGPVRVACVFSS